MSFEFNRGLFKFDFIDHHAILGMPIDASAGEIRKRFLKIARRLHPDICKAEDKQMAEALLSKLANPAYAKLSNDRERDEYAILLKMMGKRLVQEDSSVSLKSDAAKQLLQGAAFEQTYKNTLAQIAEKQYDNLSQTLETIADISELNLVYLLRKERSGSGLKKDPRPVTRLPMTTQPPTTAGVGATAPTSRQNPYVEQYCNRAAGLIHKNDLNSLMMARKELQEALKLDANSSTAHGLMGKLYFAQNQIKPSTAYMTLAKQHVTQALKLNPQEPVALEVRKLINQMVAKAAITRQTAGAKSPKKTEPKSNGGGGLFGGLFGGKKK
ncbi:MAG TPA: J domain-containing protein [Oscillatoriales cyanobacterium M59_W2019_021]|nr:MAG: J domain-containing protein [Cyanobacteria bacterium J055]HIK30057.1 J domain-containing protein [Oscillatoriales cyanobacterium M4454_W2019_049]HIK50374.1 J domain-containing protein [Oscillatoriales cyanobacterium M59_W2019_021]